MAEIDTSTGTQIAGQTAGQLPNTETVPISSDKWIWISGGLVLVLLYFFYKNNGSSGANSGTSAVTGQIIAQQTQDQAALTELGQQIKDSNDQTQTAINQISTQTNEAVNTINQQETNIQNSQLIAQDLQMQSEQQQAAAESQFQQQQTDANNQAQQQLNQTEQSIQQSITNQNNLIQQEMNALTQQTQASDAQPQTQPTPPTNVVNVGQNYADSSAHPSYSSIFLDNATQAQSVQIAQENPGSVVHNNGQQAAVEKTGPDGTTVIATGPNAYDIAVNEAHGQFINHIGFKGQYPGGTGTYFKTDNPADQAAYDKLVPSNGKAS